MNQVINTLVIFLLIQSLQAVNECFFEGCRCVKNIDYSLDVICVNQDKAVFPRRTMFYTNKTINTLLFKQYLFTEIPDGTFEGLFIRHLILGENKLKKIGSDTFKGIRSLSLLKIIEKDFETIETGAFDPINKYLNELGIWQINYQSKKIDQFFNELKKLKNLKTLSLMGYGLEQFKSEWTSIFEPIVNLNLASNEMRTIDPNIFKWCKRVESINLSNNFITNLTLILKALEPVRSTIRELKLASNQISLLEDFSMFPRLETLDLSNNMLKTIPSSFLNGLEKLNSLYFSSNLIEFIPDSLLNSVPELVTLMLDNNYLSQVPRIKNLKNLKILDLSNQNGNLKELKDFSFDRASPTCCLYLNLDENKLEIFGNKTFCSRDRKQSEIRKLDLDYKSMSNMNKCILSQLSSEMADKIEFYVNLQNDISKDSTLNCDCKLKRLLQNFEIKFIGPCSDVAGLCDQDESLKKCGHEFKC